MELSEAKMVAGVIENILEPYCNRLAVAGSIRRGKEDVGDIEIVAIPKMNSSYDLWGEKVGEHSLLNHSSIYETFGNILKSGKRFVQVETTWNINLDLFVVLPPAQWGVIMAIRTGPVDFSKWIVTPRSKGGALPNGWRVEDGRVWDGQTELPTMIMEDEREFLNWLGLGWIEPKDREAKWGSFSRTYRG